MKFTIVTQPTSVHTHCFDELAVSLTWALTQLGHDAFRDTTVRPGTRAIVLGARADDPQSPPPDAILYNGEQVNKDGMWPSLVELYSKHTVWDYSAANAQRYAECGLKMPQVVRPGYCPVLSGRIPKVPRHYDVVFFGSINDRRRKILDALKINGLSVLEVPFGVYGKKRDEMIASAALCINIHYYESSIFEAVRCSYLAQNGIHVLSERSVGDEGTEWGMPGVAYEDLVQTAHNYLMADAREEMAHTQRAMAEGVSLLDDVRAAVAALEETPGVVAQAHAGQHDRKPSGVVGAGIPYIGPPLTLCMIVKDEAHIIDRCLASVRPYISRWCIVDTGSTDGTQEVIRKHLADVPGNLHELPWREFDGSRNDAIDLARNQCDDEGWLLLIDADETLIIDGELRIPEDHDCFYGWVTRSIGAVRWARPVFARANKPWFYEMPRHEGLHCRISAPSRALPLENVTVLSSEGVSGRSAIDAHEKFLRDAAVLEQWIVSHPGHTRAAYYIAQSYRDAAHSKSPPDRQALQKAILYYMQRAEMPHGYDQETYSAMFQAGKCMSEAGYPKERVISQLLRAFNYRPSRAEPLYQLSVHFRESDQWALSELCARKAVSIPPTQDHYTDVDLGVYNWKAKDELAIALTWMNQCAEARVLNQELLRRSDLPDFHRSRIQGNLDHCNGRLGMTGK